MTIISLARTGSWVLVAALLFGLSPVQVTAQSQADAAALIAELGLIEAEQPVRQIRGWQPAKKILVQDQTVPIDALRSTAPGVQIVAMSEATNKDIAAAEVLIGGCSAEVLSKARNLRWVQVPFAGVEDCVSMQSFKERNILLTNMQRVQSSIISEHAIALTLALARNLESFVLNQPQGRWARERDGIRTLQGKTMLVVGLGGIGTEIAKRAHALGMKAVATRASGREGPDFVSYVGSPDELLDLAKDADVIASALPLTSGTTKLFDAKFFAVLKPSAYFINVGRGASVDTSALLAVLNEKRLAGAGLDVTDPEPLPADHPLWRAPNVIITPHVSGASDMPRDKVVSVIRENLRRYQAGEKMLSVVDLQRGY